MIEFDPTTQQIVWSYAGTAEQPFESEVRSSQERLANGNTLITESDGGRLFEVTPAGEIVWNYLNPVRAPAQRRPDRDADRLLGAAHRSCGPAGRLRPGAGLTGEPARDPGSGRHHDDAPAGALARLTGRGAGLRRSPRLPSQALG